MDYQLEQKIESFNSAKERETETRQETIYKAAIVFGFEFLEDHCYRCKNYASYDAALEMTEEEQQDYFEREVAGMPEFEKWLRACHVYF